MNVEKIVKDIKKLYVAIANGVSDKDIDLVYRGTEYGQKLPWTARIDKREVNALTHDEVLVNLLDMLRKELEKKIQDTQQQAKSLEKILEEVQPS